MTLSYVTSNEGMKPFRCIVDPQASRRLTMAVETASASTVAPGPRGRLLVGSALDLKRDFLGTFLRAMLEYGDVVRFVIGPPGLRRVAHGLFHPDAVQLVLAPASGQFEKNVDSNPVYREVRAFVGDGILTSEGERWRRQKRLIQPLFTHRRVAGYVPMMVEEAKAVATRWAEAARSGSPPGMIDLNAEMTRVTLSVVGRALFGADVEHALAVLGPAFPLLSRRAVDRGLSPAPIPANWPTPGNRRAERAQKGIDELVDGIIARRKAEPSETPDLIGLLLEAQDPEGGHGLDDEEVRDQVLVFLLAGHETTAISLTFTLHLLGHHPEVQDAVQQEIDDVLGGRPPTLEDLPHLVQTTMAVKEAMRLYPAVFALGRVAARTVAVNGYEIPAGTVAVVSSWVTHRHPSFWDDPERFLPERFTPEREAARHRYAYFPFGGGPRACIGSYFSMLESVAVVAVLLSSYRLTTSSDPVPLFTGITLRPAAPMPCRITPR
jgi:cytochrome P450